MTEHYRVRITMQVLDADTDDELETLKVAEDSSPFPATLKQRITENGAVAWQLLAQQYAPAAPLERIRLDARPAVAPPPHVDTPSDSPTRRIAVVAKPALKFGPPDRE